MRPLVEQIADFWGWFNQTGQKLAIALAHPKRIRADQCAFRVVSGPQVATLTRLGSSDSS